MFIYEFGLHHFTLKYAIRKVQEN